MPAQTTATELRVVANTRNAEPGWDGRPQLLTGIADRAGRRQRVGASNVCFAVASVPRRGQTLVISPVRA